MKNCYLLETEKICKLCISGSKFSLNFGRDLPCFYRVLRTYNSDTVLNLQYDVIFLFQHNLRH